MSSRSTLSVHRVPPPAQVEFTSTGAGTLNPSRPPLGNPVRRTLASQIRRKCTLCAVFWFAATCLFAGVFGWAYARAEATTFIGEEGCAHLSTRSVILKCGVDAEEHHLLASDGVQVGYYLKYADTGLDSTIVILPGYTATAEQFMCWFVPHLQGLKYNIMTVDYRGFGLSAMHYNASFPPDMNIYKGLRLSNLASDVNRIFGCMAINPRKIVAIGHSYGNAVWMEYITTYASDLSGFAFIDQPMKFTPNSTVASADFTYTKCRSPPCVHDMNAFLNNSVQKLQYSPTSPHYPFVQASYADFFAACDTVVNACMTATQSGLQEWASGTNNFSLINGKLDYLFQWNNIASDYTAEASQLRMPMFLYGGEQSLVPLDRMQWLYNVSPSTNKRKLWFYGNYSSHTPFLNPKPSIDWFFGNLTEWVQSLRLH